MPEELEKHLIHNSNRLRTFEDARLEIATHVEGEVWFEDPSVIPCQVRRELDDVHSL